MKANEIPEKIYVTEGMLFMTNPEITLCGNGNKIEYTRTDSFIKKACGGIEYLLNGYIIRNFHFGDSYDIDKLIEDFKNYIKG